MNRVTVGQVAGRARRHDAGRDIPEESLMLTGDENIVDIDFAVFWVINNAADYLFNMEDPDGTVKAVAESAMREVVGRSNIAAAPDPGPADHRDRRAEADPGDARRVRRRHPGHPGAAPQGRSAGRRHRLVPRRAGGARRPGAHPERGADLRQPGRPGGARPGFADHRGGQRLSRPDHRRGQGSGRALRQGLRELRGRAGRHAPAHVSGDAGAGLRRHGQGHHRREGRRHRRRAVPAARCARRDPSSTPGGGQ